MQIAEHSDKRLQRWYREYNAKYFGGELPDEVDTFFGPSIRDHGMYGFVVDFDHVTEMELCLDHGLIQDDRLAKIFLLHECAHIKLWPYVTHGARFHAEIQRLAALGAYRGLL